MGLAFYMTHPQVRIDPAVPVPDWGLSDVGLARAHVAARAAWTGGVTAIVSSEERKAVDTASIVAEARGLVPRLRADMHENDRSATGYLAPPEFESMADAFFANPGISVRGWERAADAQARIVAAVDEELRAAGTGDVLFVGHGAVGTLLMCHLLGEPISRQHDQKAGGGNAFCFDAATGRMRHGWLALEDSAIGVLG